MIFSGRSISHMKLMKQNMWGMQQFLARELSKKREKAVYLIAVGGDGTVNEVLNGITDFEKVRLGVIASGSGNDFEKGMGIPTDPIVCMRQILKCIRREKHGIPIKKTDLGQVTWGNGKKTGSSESVRA